MNVTQCDQCGAAQPPLRERTGWLRLHYTGMPVAANLDLCASCVGEVVTLEKLEDLIAKS